MASNPSSRWWSRPKRTWKFASLAHQQEWKYAEIEITSYAEIVLGRQEDDVAHPAFGKLFIETEYLPDSPLCSADAGHAPQPRRPPGPSTRSASMGAAVADRMGKQPGAFSGPGSRPRPSHLAGRSRPLGHDRRGARSGRQPAAAGAIAPGGFARLSFATGVSSDRAGASAGANTTTPGRRRARSRWPIRTVKCVPPSGHHRELPVNTIASRHACSIWMNR